MGGGEGEGPPSQRAPRGTPTSLEDINQRPVKGGRPLQSGHTARPAQKSVGATSQGSGEGAERVGQGGSTGFRGKHN